MELLDLHISDGGDHLLIKPTDSGTADLLLANGEIYEQGRAVKIGHLRPDELIALARWAAQATEVHEK